MSPNLAGIRAACQLNRSCAQSVTSSVNALCSQSNRSNTYITFLNRYRSFSSNNTLRMVEDVDLLQGSTSKELLDLFPSFHACSRPPSAMPITVLCNTTIFLDTFPSRSFFLDLLDHVNSNSQILCARECSDNDSLVLLGNESTHCTGDERAKMLEWP